MQNKTERVNVNASMRCAGMLFGAGTAEAVCMHIGLIVWQGSCVQTRGWKAKIEHKH